MHLEAIGKWTLDVLDSSEIPEIKPYLKDVASRMGHLENPYYPLQKAMEKARYVFSEDITDLIKYMLLPYPKQRIKAKNVCTHRWFDSECIGSEYFYKMADPMVLVGAVGEEEFEEESEDEFEEEQAVAAAEQEVVVEQAEQEVVVEQAEQEVVVEQEVEEQEVEEQEVDEQEEYEAEDRYVVEIHKEFKVHSKKVRKEIRTKRYREKQHCLKMIHRKTKHQFF
jgi:ribosome-binding ATPase YchF (GTP1/OBG family)